MIVSRRRFLSASGTTALVGSGLILGESAILSRLTGQDRISSDRPLAFMLVDQHYDLALMAKPDSIDGTGAMTLIEKAASADLYGWIQAQCGHLSGYKLAAISDDVGDVMLSLALRDLAAPVTFLGTHMPSGTRNPMLDHRITFFKDPENAASLHRSLTRRSWVSTDISERPIGELLVTSAADWTGAFVGSIAEVFTRGPALAPLAVLSRLGERRFSRFPASRSTLADI